MSSIEQIKSDIILEKINLKLAKKEGTDDATLTSIKLKIKSLNHILSGVVNYLKH